MLNPTSSNEIFATLLTEMMFNNLNVSTIDQNAFDAIFKQLKKKNYF